MEERGGMETKKNRILVSVDPTLGAVSVIKRGVKLERKIREDSSIGPSQTGG